MAKGPNEADVGGLPNAPPSGPPLPILPLLNTIIILGVLGFLFYSKFIFKRPPITETQEREKLTTEAQKPSHQITAGFVDFPTITVNIESNPSSPKPADGTLQQIHGKMHYATVGFSVEIRDISQKETLEALQAKIVDRLILMLGKKPYHVLNTVQGRYVLQAQFLNAINQIIISQSNNNGEAKTHKDEGLATRIYFNQFIVQ